MNVLFFKEGFGGPFEIPQAIFMPLQGFWNFVIYAKPTLERIQEEYPELSFRLAFRKMIFRPSEVRARRRTRRSTTRSTAVIAAAVRLALEVDEEEHAIDKRNSSPTSSSSNNQHDRTKNKKDEQISPLDVSAGNNNHASNNDKNDDISMEEGSPNKSLLQYVEDDAITDDVRHEDSFQLPKI